MRSQPITAACIRLEHGPFKKFLSSKIFFSLKMAVAVGDLQRLLF